ncbi:N4-gp56 family major capsid protein [Marinobacter shengliensis]|uniref:N4-gp56 family major capsid protein n=1 Tax=Marinobacter shengliensis TaxID=1389223 RepID=UPI001E46A6A7|nr:N4-gp56 family major capsid protein [Marinobacter shengliensis]MCD1628470.1 N4-gp56 family major capsid protein [Marinobacter shengliensis]
MGRQYNDPAGGAPSNIGTQMNDFFYQKQALVEAKKEQYFSPLADVTSMPKHFGKKIKKYHYIPLLDDENINDQGIDATGATIANGNLYGSSKDIGSIPGKFPVLSETGGRVNRVGFKRKELEGSIEKFGFFDEYTQESLDFDSDAELMQHINREMIFGANEITEDMLQIDLINSAGVVKYSGAATDIIEVNKAAMVTYRDLLRLSIDLDNNRTPKQTRVVTGTRMIDTKTIPAARVMYIGSELQPTIEAMVDLHGNPAFIPVQKYASGGTVLNGEIGTVGYFRVVVVPEMMNWTGAGADATAVTGDDGESTHYTTGGKYDVFPMLVVGDGSFTTIGFLTDGKTVKFKITHKKPGTETADRNDPYGEMGFMSIKWYYGFMALRPERLAVQYSAAEL